MLVSKLHQEGKLDQNNLKMFYFFIVIIFLCTGCKPKEASDNSYTKFISASQVEWNEVSKKYYLVSISMRKIDSLSANMNLRFTIKNAYGL